MVKNNMRHNFTTKYYSNSDEIITFMASFISLFCARWQLFFLFAIKGCFTKMDNNVLYLRSILHLFKTLCYMYLVTVWTADKLEWHCLWVQGKTFHYHVFLALIFVNLTSEYTLFIHVTTVWDKWVVIYIYN